MRFGVLGPLAASDGAREIAPGRGLQRMLLATLLAHANEIVLADAIVDALWGESPPASADHAVEVHVSELRRRIEDGGARRVLTRAGGYQLRVEDGELDAAEFERWCREARHGLARGDVRRALVSFRQAEGLWRGNAYGELARQAALHAEAARLDGLRSAARLDRLDAQLLAGETDGLLTDVEAQIAADPWNERLHALRMLALYRDGRQTDALRVYTELRATLEADLGVEPGPALERLQVAVLNHDPALMASMTSLGLFGGAAQGDAPPPGRIASSAHDVPAASRLSERLLVSTLSVELLEANAGVRTVGVDPERRHATHRRLLRDVEGLAAPLGGSSASVADGSILVAIGTGPGREDHAERALRLALAVRERVRASYPSELAAGIVVDRGELVLHEAADPAATAAPVGDVVRLRRRVEPDMILVGGRAAALGRRWFELQPAVASNTPAGLTNAYRLVGLAPSSRTRDGTTALVGRQTELTALDREWALARSHDEPRLVLVVGDPGVGKSALVRAWTHTTGGDGTPVLRGRCLAYGQGITYWPLAEVLRERIGITAADDDRAVLDRLGERRILGLTLGLDVVPGLHPMAARRSLHAAWVDLLEAEAQVRPLVLVLEDLHWAEAPLLELVAGLIHDIRGPLLVIATSRPELSTEDRRRLDAGRRSTTLWLEPLGAGDARRLVESLLEGGVAAGLDVVLDRAEGNPFFVEELIANLIDDRRLRRDGERWQVDPEIGAVLPDSIRGVLAARLEGLGPEVRRTLQVASVVGRRFDVPSVEALLGRPALEVDELVERELIRALPPRAGADQRRFVFKHALTRDAAYRTLTIAGRAHLHASLAEHLDQAGAPATDHAAILAHHFGAAVAADGADIAWAAEPARLAALESKARRWSVEAARIAAARYAIDDAVALLERALACHPTREEASRIWLEIGRANILRYDGLGFWTAMEQAIDRATTDDERAAIYAELAFETAFRWAIWTRMPERQLVDGWIDQALALAPAGSRAELFALIALAYWHPLDAADAPERAIAIAEALDDPSGLSYALDAHALAAFTAGDDVAAHARWERRAAIAGRISDLDHLEDLYGAGIAGSVALGRFDEARAFADRHNEVAMQLSPHHQLHAVAMHLELEELAAGWPRMLELVARAEAAVAVNLATPCVRNQRSLLACALAAARLGRDAESRRLEAAADALGMQGYEAVFDPLRVRLAVRRGDVDAIRARLPLRMPPPTKNWWRLTSTIAELEGWLAMDATDEIRAGAPRLLVPGTLLEPFAELALGTIEDDATLVARARRGLAAMGIPADAMATRVLRA